MVCLDTSFVIDFLRGKENAKRVKEKLDLDEESLTLASITVMELIAGTRLSEKSKEEEEKVMRFLSSLIILDFDKEGAILAGEIKAKLRQKGELIETEDIMIGAIAKKNNETLITRNTKHFEKIHDLTIEGY